MKKYFALQVLLASLFSMNAWAAEFSLGSAAGMPGDTVTVVLSIDEVPLDESNLFSADVTVQFDQAVLAFVTSRQVGVFNAPPAAFAVPEINLTGNVINVDLAAQYDDGTGNPATRPGGELIELDFMVLDAESGGQTTLVIGASSEDVLVSVPANGAGNGQVEVVVEPVQVPLPLPWLAIGALFCVIFGFRRSIDRR